MRHLVDEFYFDEVNHLSFNVCYETLEFYPSILDNIKEISECTEIDKEQLYRFVKVYNIFNHIENTFPSTGDKEKIIPQDIYFCYLVEKYFGIFTNPKQFFEVSSKLFKVDSKKCRWARGFGGSTWFKITNIIKDRESYSKIMFVDLCWSL